jgi:hypothetical protein
MQTDHVAYRPSQYHQCSPELYWCIETYCQSQDIKLKFALDPEGIHLSNFTHAGIRYVADKQGHNSNQSTWYEYALPSSDSQALLSLPGLSFPIPSVIRDIIHLQIPGRD